MRVPVLVAAGLAFVFLSGCLCGPREHWQARWDQPGLAEKIPADNRSHPAWVVDDMTGGTMVFQDKGLYYIEFALYFEGMITFTVFKRDDVVSKETAEQEFDRALDAFGLQDDVNRDAVRWELIKLCG